MVIRVVVLVGLSLWLTVPTPGLARASAAAARANDRASASHQNDTAPSRSHGTGSHRTDSHGTSNHGSGSAAPASHPMTSHTAGAAATTEPAPLVERGDAAVSPPSREAMADILVRLDALGRQAALTGKRIEASEERLGSEARERWQDAAAVQRRLTEYEARLDAQDARWAEANASRNDLPLLLTAGGTLLALLLGSSACVIALRHRAAVMAEAEVHADRLFRTYRLEFDMLAQGAHELEARLQSHTMPDAAEHGPLPERMIIGRSVTATP